MPDPHLSDPQKLGDYGSLLAGVSAGLAALGTAIAWPYRTFVTRKSANETFVKKVEPDGTRAYVHPQEWAEMKSKIDKSIEQGEKWQSIAKDWIERG